MIKYCIGNFVYDDFGLYVCSRCGCLSAVDVLKMYSNGWKVFYPGGPTDTFLLMGPFPPKIMYVDGSSVIPVYDYIYKFGNKHEGEANLFEKLTEKVIFDNLYSKN